MQGLLNRFQKRHSTSQESPTIHTDTWSLAIDNYQLQWNVLEVEALISAENKRPVYATLQTDNGPQIFQTLILSVNIETNNASLDNFYPHIGVGTLYRTGPFELSIPTRDSKLILRCIAIGENGQYARESVAVKILEKRWSSNARADSLIRFDSQSSPKIALVIPMEGQLLGLVHQISPSGFEMTCLKLQAHNLRDIEAECSIAFSDTFNFQSRVKIKDSKTLRKPHNHTRLKAIFIKMSSDKREQIEGFLRLINQSIC